MNVWYANTQLNSKSAVLWAQLGHSVNYVCQFGLYHARSIQTDLGSQIHLLDKGRIMNGQQRWEYKSSERKFQMERELLHFWIQQILEEAMSWLFLKMANCSGWRRKYC